MSERSADGEERDLVAKLIAGDPAAFDRFFRDFFPRLYRFVLPRLNGIEADAEDVVQATMIKAMRRMDSFRGEARLFTWLCAICRNEMVDFIRRERKPQYQHQELLDSEEVQEALASLGDARGWDPELASSSEELSGLVHATLDHLPSRYGDVLEWRYVRGETVNEIAARLELGREAADSLMARARRAFRKGFEEVVIAARGVEQRDLLPE